MSLRKLRALFLSKEFILYTIIGLSGVLLDVIIFLFLTKALDINLFIANILSISAGIINNFYLNSRYNFNKRDYAFKRFLLFYVVGLLGIILSQVLLYLFYKILGVDSSVAKVLTLPFVLVFQYLLNKKISFGMVDKYDFKKLLRTIVFHWPIIIIILSYSYLSVVMIGSIPSDYFSGSKTASRVKLRERGGPDESTHYRFNVDFILNNKRLPVSGVDDLEAYRACRQNPIGKVPCVYSYTIYPAPSYVLSAVSAKLFSNTGRLTPMVAARVPSLIYGVTFVIFSYITAYLIVRKRLYASILTTMICFIPQLIFVNSYLNLDAHSLAISAILGFSLVYFVQDPKKIIRQLLLIFSLFGLLPLAKYNFFILGIPTLATVLWVFREQRFKTKSIGRFFLYGGVSFTLFSAFWYIRNLILYRDPLGQTFVLQKMSEFHQLGTPHNFSLDSFILLVKHDYFNTLYRSFFVAYGQMTFFLQDYMYIAAQLTLLVCLCLSIYLLVEPLKTMKNTDRRKLIYVSLLFLFTFISTIGVTVYNTLVYDFQPQGRYLYPILIPTLIALAYGIRRDSRFKIIAYIMLAITIFIFIQGVELYIRAYLVNR